MATKYYGNLKWGFPNTHMKTPGRSAPCFFDLKIGKKHVLVSSCEVECMAMIHNPSEGFLLEKFSVIFDMSFWGMSVDNQIGCLHGKKIIKQRHHIPQICYCNFLTKSPHTHTNARSSIFMITLDILKTLWNEAWSFRRRWSNQVGGFHLIENYNVFTQEKIP